MNKQMTVTPPEKNLTWAQQWNQTEVKLAMISKEIKEKESQEASQRLRRINAMLDEFEDNKEKKT